MTRLSEIKREKTGNRSTFKNKDSQFIGFCAAIACLDSYCLRKDGKTVSLRAYKGLFNNDFYSDEEQKLLEPLANWLVTLPKGVWD